MVEVTNQSIWSLGEGRIVFMLVSRYVLSASVVLLLVQLLYMLKMEQKPKLPLRHIAMMSLFGIFSAVYELVEMLVLTRMIGLIVGWLSA